jgi:hypothetical protein
VSSAANELCAWLEETAARHHSRSGRTSLHVLPSASVNCCGLPCKGESGIETCGISFPSPTLRDDSILCMPDVAAKRMPNATAFVLNAIEESFTAVGALSTAFDAGLAALRDATLSNRAYTHGPSSSSPAHRAVGDGAGVAVPSARRALGLSSQCTVSVAECSIPDNSEPAATCANRTPGSLRGCTLPSTQLPPRWIPSIATGTPVRAHSSR